MSFVKTPQDLIQLTNIKAEFYDAEMIFAFWLTKPEIIEHLLPPPLKPQEVPQVAAFVANYPRTSFGLPYREAALFIAAKYDQVPGSYCLSMPVTNDIAMALGRENLGFPKKMAQIELNRVGNQILGFVERNGVRFFELEFSFDDQYVADAFKDMIQQGLAFHQETGSASYLFKSFNAPDNQLFDYPPRLVRQNTVFRPKTIEWGQATIRLTHSDSDPWDELEIVNPLGAVQFIGDNTMLPGQVLTEVDPMAFIPYAFIKWDW